MLCILFIGHSQHAADVSPLTKCVVILILQVCLIAIQVVHNMLYTSWTWF